ncbi:MAG: transposase [Pseudomonadota bacterium]
MAHHSRPTSRPSSLRRSRPALPFGAALEPVARWRLTLDNLSTHRNERADAALRARGRWFLSLPPYSPDLNPIEQAYAKLKPLLRQIGARIYDQVVAALRKIGHLFSPEECLNSFRHASYAST